MDNNLISPNEKEEQTNGNNSEATQVEALAESGESQEETTDEEIEYDLTDDDPSISGWLWIYLVRLLIGTLLSAKPLIALIDFANYISPIYYISQIGCTLLFLYTIIAIFRRMPNAVFLAKSVEIINIVLCIILYTYTDTYYDALGNHSVDVTLVIGIIWFAYLCKSKLLKHRFPKRKAYIFDYILIATIILTYAYTIENPLNVITKKVHPTPTAYTSDLHTQIATENVECEYHFETPKGFTCIGPTENNGATEYFITDNSNDPSISISILGGAGDFNISKTEFRSFMSRYEFIAMSNYSKECIDETLKSKGDVYTYYNKTKYLNTNTPETFYWVFIVKNDQKRHFSIAISSIYRGEKPETQLSELISSITINEKE